MSKIKAQAQANRNMFNPLRAPDGYSATTQHTLTTGRQKFVATGETSKLKEPRVYAPDDSAAVIILNSFVRSFTHRVTACKEKEI
eukprot:332216-Pelagomonas_calceolata.AAC.1